ncbi:MAG: beta-1,6-N-acetylglucosaminyltransferase [Leptolyngbyaceae cyanobacterium bins.302]|nr:beta-1,6-N-acetylglucosaminyltransferase [Leptolyngbyaceae cyanobacterium bins.302]
MRIAFVMLAHKFPEQIARLIHVLSLEDDHFFIHIDRRSPTVFNAVQKTFAANSRVVLTDERYACRWGQFSLVGATLSCLRKVCAAKEHYDYVLLISGQDYPIKPLPQLKRYLEQNQGKQFMDAFPFLEPNPWSEHTGIFQPARRVLDWHFFLRSRHLHIPIKRKIPNKLVPYGGSQWWALTGECVQHLMQYLDQHPNVTNYFKHTLIPDEIFFQTLICNSPFKQDISGSNLTYADWLNPNPFPPRVLTLEDIDPLKTSDLFLARKFEPERSGELLDLIDRELLSCPQPPTATAKPE